MSFTSPITTRDGTSVKTLEGMEPRVLLLEDTQKKVKELAYEIINASEGGEASWLSRVILAKIGHISANAHEQKAVLMYKTVAYALKHVSLASISEDTLLDLFQHHLVPAFVMGIDVLYYVARFLRWVLIEEDIGAMRGLLIQALTVNTEVIGKGYITPSGGKRAKPEVREWLGEYDLLFEGPKGPLQEVEYLNQSGNVKMLGEEERAVLRKLLQVYDLLRYPENQKFPETSEAPNAAWFGVWQGERETASAHQTELVSAFNALPIPLSSIQSTVSILAERERSQPYIIGQILANPARVRDKAYVVGALLLQIRNPKSPPALPAKGERAGEIRNKDEVKSYIRGILEGALGWSEEDSAKLGIRIGNMLGSGYRGWAYYNKASRRFEWE